MNIPGRNQSRDEIIELFRLRILTGDSFLMPYSSIVETGNHISRLAGDQKFQFAEKFRDELLKALQEKAPWKPLKFPTHEDLAKWLKDFPKFAAQATEFADFSIIKEWEEQRSRYQGYEVHIWSLDHSLSGY